MPLFLYRTLDSDTDGDPLDFGLVRAPDDKAATRFVGEHLVDVLGEEIGPMEFKLYEVVPSSKDGVVENKRPTKHRHPK